MLVPVYLKLRAGADNSLPRVFFFFFCLFVFFKIAAVRARKESILPATPASLKLASNQRFRGQFLRSENQVHSHFAARILAPRSNPLPFYIPLMTVKVPLSYNFLLNI